MIRCFCCECRLGHSLIPCGCGSDYCPLCLLCDEHCQCEPVAAVAVADDSRSDGPMLGRPWYDQCRVHEPLRADQHRNPCAVCGRYTCECVPGYYLKLKNEEPFASDLTSPRGSAEERAFFFAIERSPLEERTPRLVFA